MKLIGFIGGIGSGKTTAAQYLERNHWFIWESFARPLKELVRDVFGLENRHVFGSQADKSEHLFNGPDGLWTPRRILEFIGTDCFRRIKPDVWVDLCRRNVMEALLAAPVCIDDVRFPNEADMIRSLGGRIVLLERVGHQAERTSHVSDSAWQRIRWDHRITAADLLALHCQLDNLLAEPS